jgi:thiopeptide-type bacteriocin biosynthesis protein
MLNTQQAPNVYRFLREISMERQRQWQSYAWNGLDHAPMLPRLRYGRAVLTAARWKLNSSLQPFRKDMSLEEWQEAFDRYCQQWRVPRYVYLSVADQRILLDLDHSLHREEVYRDFIRLHEGESLTLIESGLPGDHQWVTRSDGGHFLMEAVFPLVKRAQHRNPSGISPFVRGERPMLPKQNRVRMPGSEWLYVKWYVVSQREEELIAGHLMEILHQAQQQGWAQVSYFIRFADPAPHLRLRFCGEPAKLVSELLPWLHRVASQCMQEGTLSKMVIESYEPELERYGGPALMPLAEHFFAADSRAAAHWTSLQYQGQMNLTLDMIAVISVIDIFENFGLAQEEQLRWLEDIVSRRQHLDLFRLHRKEYLQYADPRAGFAGLRDHPDAGSILPLLQHRAQPLRRYAEAVHRDHAAGTLTNELQNLVQSVIHMHLNRLLGIDRERENRVLTLTRHTLNALVQQRRNSR